MFAVASAWVPIRSMIKKKTNQRRFSSASWAAMGAEIRFINRVVTRSNLRKWKKPYGSLLKRRQTYTVRKTAAASSAPIDPTAAPRIPRAGQPCFPKMNRSFRTMSTIARMIVAGMSARVFPRLVKRAPYANVAPASGML